MRRLVQLALVALIVYFGVTAGLPWVRGWVEGISEEKIVGKEQTGGGQARCLDSANEANRFLDREIRSYSPPVDPEAWGDSYYEMVTMLTDARTDCTCADEVCDVTGAAIDEMSAMITAIDRDVRSGEDFANRLPRRQVRIDELLQQARAALDDPSEY